MKHTNFYSYKGINFKELFNKNFIIISSSDPYLSEHTLVCYFKLRLCNIILILSIEYQDFFPQW